MSPVNSPDEENEAWKFYTYKFLFEHSRIVYFWSPIPFLK